MSINKVASRTPTPLRQRIAKTPVKKMIDYVVARAAKTQSFEIVAPCGSFVHTIPNGMAHNGDQIKQLRDLGMYEPTVTSELCRRFKDSTVFYDVGSFVGYHIGLALSAGVPADYIHAFEGNSAPYYFADRQFDIPNHNNTYVDSGTQSLDTYAKTQDNPDVVKIDVEGAEVDVLKNMTGIIESNSPAVYVEIHPQAIAERGNSIDAILSLLSEFGYVLEYADHRQSEPSWTASPPRGAENYLARGLV